MLQQKRWQKQKQDLNDAKGFSQNTFFSKVLLATAIWRALFKNRLQCIEFQQTKLDRTNIAITIFSQGFISF